MELPNAVKVRFTSDVSGDYTTDLVQKDDDRLPFILRDAILSSDIVRIEILNIDDSVVRKLAVTDFWQEKAT